MVMPALVAGHPRLYRCAGSQDVDGRNKSGHDERVIAPAASP